MQQAFEKLKRGSDFRIGFLRIVNFGEFPALLRQSKRQSFLDQALGQLIDGEPVGAREFYFSKAGCNEGDYYGYVVVRIRTG